MNSWESKLSKILYGGDYNPEQWPREIWDEDMRLFQLAGVDIATINVFSWALNQPDETTYRFEWLDEVMDLLHRHHIKVCLGTGTAAHPAWMATKYPDVLTVDSQGKKRKFGRRHNSCPSSPTFRRYSAAIAGRLAERYRNHPALLLWHVNNEYGWRCYCDNCAAAFRVWLRQRYGTLEALNDAWYTRFWGHTFYEWQEIVPPSQLSEHLSSSNPDATAFQGMTLDYYRFISDQFLDCYRLERDAIKSQIPDAVVTTNFQSNGTYKPLDYFKWAQELDVIALDIYPVNETPMSYTAMRYDLMRGLGNGASFLLMESCPSQLNWKPQNALKRPGINKLWSYQAIARGADSIMYFQLRRSSGAFEKFHGAMIDHAGHEHTRVFRECAELGQELNGLGDRLIGARTEARVAIVMDYDNWWAVESSSGLTDQLKYLEEVQTCYDALYAQHIAVDFVSVDSPLASYELVIAPVLYMVKSGYAAKLEAYVEDGGLLLTTCFSGIADEHDRIPLGGYPGPLRKLLGIWVEEIDALKPGTYNRLTCTETYRGVLPEETSCGMLCELIHLEGAEAVACYEDDFYAGMPALTRHRYGAGEAWHVGSKLKQSALNQLISGLCRDRGLREHLEIPEGVELTRRAKEGRSYLFLLNHNDHEATVNLEGEGATRLDGNNSQPLTEVKLAAHGVVVLQLAGRREDLHE